MVGDLLVFLGNENPHQAARCGGADGIVRAVVADLVEAKADPGQATADRAACFAVMFSDAAGEDQQVDAVERDETAEPLDEGFGGENRTRGVALPVLTGRGQGWGARRFTKVQSRPLWEKSGSHAASQLTAFISRQNQG